MREPRPFIYIAALRRSGSTLLAEMLTDPPRSFILREPRLARGEFSLKPDDTQRLAPFGIDLPAIAASCTRFPRDRAVRRFARHARDITASIEQIGVKEIGHRHWQRYARALPNIRAIVLARDPRDIYLSILARADRGVETARAIATPQRCADALLEEYERQLDIARSLPTLRLRYEDLCTGARTFDEIRAFVDSPLDTPGTPGQFNRANPERAVEAATHHAKVTGAQVARWSREPNPERREDADRVYQLMRTYAEDWGYARDASPVTV